MATNTYVALDKVTVSGSSTTSVTLSSIPATYTDLVLVVSCTASSTSNNYVHLQFNGDTATNYSTTIVSGNGSTSASTRFANRNNFNIDYTATPSNNEISTRIVHIQNYSNTTTYKTGLVRANRAGGGTDATVGMWRSTAAINSILVTIDSDTFAVGSTFSLYGIKATSVTQGTAKATGGTITYDMSGYVYHTFTSSGTFTPSQTLLCDYLVIAGGGGSGNAQAGSYDGGAGGAGGVRSTLGQTGGGGALESQLSLSATGYTVTIGQGGAAATAGQNTTFSSITSTGGGRGYSNTAGTTGGSGGAGGTVNSYLAGTSNQGFRGGTESGGGAGGVGGFSVGGIGVYIPDFGATGTGVNGYYGGGGGRAYNSWAGGAGGGGQGANNGVGTAGTANTGGGAGGSRAISGGQGGATGGSGLVIVRYYGL